MISSKTIEQTAEKIFAMTEPQSQTLARYMEKEQSYLLVYMAAMNENEEFTDDEADIFFNVGTIIWQTMRQNPNGNRMVTEQMLEIAEKENEDFLLKLEKDLEGDFYSASETMTLNYSEPELFRYIVQSLFEDEEENPKNPPFNDEHLGAAFLHLKIILDTLIVVQR